MTPESHLGYNKKVAVRDSAPLSHKLEGSMGSWLSGPKIFSVPLQEVLILL